MRPGKTIAARPQRTKAEMRALRETVGMTRAAFAAEVGATESTVRQWETSSSPSKAPKGAWDALDAAVERQERALAAYGAGQGGEVVMPYWESQEEYDRWRRPGDPPDWRMSNANARRAAAVARARGLKVSWSSVGEAARPREARPQPPSPPEAAAEKEAKMGVTVPAWMKERVGAQARAEGVSSGEVVRSALERFLPAGASGAGAPAAMAAGGEDGQPTATMNFKLAGALKESVLARAREQGAPAASVVRDAVGAALAEDGWL